MAWEEEKERYIEKLERILDGIDKINDLKENRIVTPAMRTALTGLRQAAAVLLPKLRGEEFEIAVVGLEKAGKSTFVNAFIGLNVLPTADERCTFTSTCIRPSDTDWARVSFYPRQEFDLLFQQKLEKIGIPDAGNYTVESLSLESYQQLYKECPEELRQQYANSLNKEIEATLRGGQILLSYTGTGERRFDAEQLQSETFRAFIVNPAQAMAVKEAVIYSTNLKAMPNAVMYDVPGFDSPTAIHREQTLRRMRDADAIIMVASAKAPSLTSTVLNIFQDQLDMDSIYLTDKIFVFANKLDWIDTPDQVEKNKNTTYHEWIDVNQVLRDTDEGRSRIVFGSARARMDTPEGAKSRESLKALGVSDGIDELRKKLQTYYATVRFEVLKKRVDRILDSVREMFQGVAPALDMAPDGDARRMDLAINLRQDLADRIKGELEKLKDHLNQEAHNDKPLTASVAEQIRSLITVENYAVTASDIKRVHMQVAGIGSAELPTHIDYIIRQERFREMYGDFMDRVLRCTGSRHTEVCGQILKIFMNAMNVTSEASAYERLTGEVTQLCGLSDVQDDNYYLSLIERFSRDVFEVQIRHPLGSDDRLNKFREEAANFFSLGVFYDPDHEGVMRTTDSPLWRILLYPDSAAITVSLDMALAKLTELTGLDPIGDPVRQLMAQLISRHGEQTLQVLEDHFGNFFINHSRTTPLPAVHTAVSRDLNKLVNDSPRLQPTELLQMILPPDSTFYQTDITQKRGQHTHQKVQEEFSADVAALQRVLEYAVVPAVNIDKAFNAREVKLIEDVIAMLGGSGDDRRFNSFVSRNAETIEASEFRRLKQEEEQHMADMGVMNEIRKILDSAAMPN